LLTRKGIDQLSTALSGKGLPQRSVVARALANEDAAAALTEHQAVVLDAIQLLNRVEIRGGAGSGKTFLAMEQARRLSAKGRGVSNRLTSASSTTSASSGEHPRDPTKPCAATRPSNSGNVTFRSK
jgi:hypothetical protein